MTEHKKNMFSTTMPLTLSPDYEKSVYDSWLNDNYVYKRMKMSRCKNSFVIYDKPVTSIGNSLSFENVFNKILKDFIVKYKYFNGHKINFVPSWSCHERDIEEVFDTFIKNFSREDYRDFIIGYIQAKKEQFKKLGIVADWDNQNILMSEQNEFAIYQKIRELICHKVLVQKPTYLYWSFELKTFLDPIDDIDKIKYKECEDYSAYVICGTDNKYLVHTECPNLIPMASALAIDPNVIYTKVKFKDFTDWVWVSKEFLKHIKEEIESYGYDSLGANMELKQVTLFSNLEVPLIHKNIYLKQSTGIEFVCPKHIKSDYEISVKNKLDVSCVLDRSGKYTKFEFEGAFFDDKEVILNYLEKEGRVFSKKKQSFLKPYYEDFPLLNFYTKDQWFVDFSKINKRYYDILDKITMSFGNKSSLVSRKKNQIYANRIGKWGIPIAYFVDKDGNILNMKEVNSSISDVFKNKGVDSWFTENNEFFNPVKWKDSEIFKIDSRFKKSRNVVSSNLTNAIPLSLNENPVDLVIESDLSWISNSIQLYTVLKGNYPFKELVTHGIPESKLLPMEICEEFGSEILRLWATSFDKNNSCKVERDKIIEIKTDYLKIRQTFRTLLMGLGKTRAIINGEVNVIDLWILNESRDIFNKIDKKFLDNDFYNGMNLLMNFINDDLQIYFNSIKDFMIYEKPNDNRCCNIQYVLGSILESMIILLAPILTLTAQEVFDNAPEWFVFGKVDVFSMQFKLPSSFAFNFESTFWKKVLKEFKNHFYDLKNKGIVENPYDIYLQGQKMFPCISSWFGVSDYGKNLDGEILDKFCYSNEEFVLIKANKNKCERCQKRLAEDKLCNRCIYVTKVN